MKRFIHACLCWLLCTSAFCQTVADPVLDSLLQPLPANATLRAQTERLEAILWRSFVSEEISTVAYANQFDSLLRCCVSGKTDDARFDKRLLAEAQLFNGSAILYDNPAAAKPFFETALSQFAAMGDSGNMALVFMELAVVASGLGDSLLFSTNLHKAERLESHIKDPTLNALFHNNLGIPCYDFGLYAEAADHYFKALAIVEKYRTPELMAGKRDIYHNLAGIYQRLGDFANAITYVQKAIQSAKEMGEDPSDHQEMMGWVYTLQKDYHRALEAFLAIEENRSDQSLNRIAIKSYGLASCYRNLGEVEKALPLAQKAVEMLPVSRNVHYGSAALNELAECEFAMGMTDQALKHALLAFENFEKGKNNRGGMETSEVLSRIYRTKGNYRKAFEYSERRYLYASQIERQQSNRQLAFGEFTRNAESEKARREAEIQAQLTRQRNIRYALFAGLGVLALLASLLYNRFRLKQKTAAELEAKNHEVEAARARAEASEAFKSRFLANMSHEIRTPLHGIAGFADLLLETSLSEKQRRWLSSIHHSTDRLTEVVNDILDLSKLEAGEVKLRQIPFSPARIAQDVQESLALRAELKGIRLKLDLGENLPPAVLGDPTRLYQILMNLAGNAVKFTEKGEVRLMVDGDRHSVGNTSVSLHFSVADTGIGVPKEKLASIFDSFQQAGEDTTVRFGGTGLGLTIARELVQLHGSDIQVESTVGEGSTFSFSILFPVADHMDLEKETTLGESLYFTQVLRILLADDNAYNREIAVEALHRHFENVEIIEATNGREAVEILRSSAGVAIVLMDMQMPEMTGVESTRYIRQHISKDLPIVALTASATPEEIEQALAAGMNSHLAKPFKPHELARAVAGALGLSNSATPSRTPESTMFQKTPISPKTSDTFDLTFLRDFCDGDEAQMRHFIQKFMAQYPAELARLEEAFSQKDHESLYRASHSFKPQLEFVGLNSAAAQMAELEEKSRSGADWPILAHLIENVKKELAGLSAATWRLG